MSGYNDPYRHPREERRDRNFDDRSHFQRDERGGRGGRGGYGGGYGGRNERDFRDDRGGGGYGGARGRPHWEDDDREPKRGRYEDYDRSRADNHSPYDPYSPSAPSHQHHQGYPQQTGHPSYGQPAYLSQLQQSTAQDTGAAPSTGRKPVQPEAPSNSVILLGLPPHVADVQLRQFLEDMGASIDSTTVIMDRATGLSKRYGFASFSSVEHARAFIEPNFPSIPWKTRNGPGPDDGMRIKINYSQKTGGWREDQGAQARLTEDQRRSEGGGSQSFYLNDGTRDIGSTPSHILLFRGLDPLTNEDDIVSGLYRVGGRASHEITRGGIKKVYVAKDRASRSSWGFAFVEFSNTRLASETLASIFNPQLHPTGFRIRNSVAAVSFKHENSFTPVYAASPWAFSSDGGQQLAYWDDKSYVQPWTPPPPPNQAELMKNVPKAPRAVEEAKADADMEAFFDSIKDDMPPEEAQAVAAATALPAAAVIAAPPAPASADNPLPQSAPSTMPSELPAAGSIAPITIKPIAAASPAKAEALVKLGPTPVTPAPASSVVPAPATAAPLGGKEKKGDLIVSRKAAGSIAKWNTKAKELRTKPATTGAPTANPAQAASQPQPSSPTEPAPATTSGRPIPADDLEFEFEHGSPFTFVCFLCQRQFKGIEELKKHNKLSALHKAYPPHTLSSTNLANPEAVAISATRKATDLKKQAAATTAAAASATAASKPKYVDRAAARREALGESDEPVRGKGKKRFEAPEAPKPVEQPNKDGLEESNKGLKMLEKMGWSSGAGLGASGDGRVAPVQAAQFQQRAGLGASKGVAVGQQEEKKTYGETLREKAFQRYNES
ncbi:hypothetical protein JCM11641_005751 [Rhodosporidiobolus odoratus]